jgi:hypothetical protein
MLYVSQIIQKLPKIDIFVISIHYIDNLYTVFKKQIYVYYPHICAYFYHMIILIYVCIVLN